MELMSSHLNINFFEKENNTVSKKLQSDIFDAEGDISKASVTEEKKRALFQSDTDALDLIDQILSQYVVDKTNHAEKLANQIEVASNAISEINRLWGLIMQDNLSHTNPNDTTTTTPLGDGNSRPYLTEINDIIVNDLGNPEGIKAITGYNLNDSINHRVSYGDLQAMNATMTAYCDTIQVDLDTEQQNFKNAMTQISSAQEEITDIRRLIVNLSQSG